MERHEMKVADSRGNAV